MSLHVSPNARDKYSYLVSPSEAKLGFTNLHALPGHTRVARPSQPVAGAGWLAGPAIHAVWPGGAVKLLHPRHWSKLHAHVLYHECGEHLSIYSLL